MGAVFGCDICFSHPPFKPSASSLNFPCFITGGVSTFVLPLELVHGRASFCLSVASALCFSRSCFLWALSLSLCRDSGSFVFSVFKPLNGNWKVGGRMGGNKKNENMGVFLSLRIGTGFSYNGFIGILINLWHNYILLYSE